MYVCMYVSMFGIGKKSCQAVDVKKVQQRAAVDKRMIG